MADRRTFLRGLAGLPLVGGGVVLVGRPTAAAVPVTDGLLHAYEAWLDSERAYLRWERYGRDKNTAPHPLRNELVWRDRTTGDVWDAHWHDSIAQGFDHATPSTRAAVILSAAGVPLTGGRARV